jgi:hypothetical protein
VVRDDSRFSNTQRIGLGGVPADTTSQCLSLYRDVHRFVCHTSLRRRCVARRSWDGPEPSSIWAGAYPFARAVQAWARIADLVEHRLASRRKRVMRVALPGRAAARMNCKTAISNKDDVCGPAASGRAATHLSSTIGQQFVLPPLFLS